MHYYATFSPYGNNTICTTRDRLMQFSTREDRDAVVDQINDATAWEHPEGRAEAVTLREVARKFNVRHFDNLDICREGGRCPSGRMYWEIGYRPSYFRKLTTN